MTLSPSRSFKNFPDSPNTRTNSGKWLTSTAVLKAAFPACFALLFAASMYFYSQITSQASYLVSNSPAIDISSSSASYFSRQWLHAQVRQLGPSADRFHPGISQQALVQLDPFSLSSGINVWDLYPPLISCPDVTRVGKIGEGGKWVCALQHLANEERCVMYSFGISTDISFEVEILMRTNCIIHAFDPTVGKLPYHNLRSDLIAAMTKEQRGRIRFHKTAMGARSGSSEMHSFNEQLFDIMHRLGHSFINLLKVDIEGGEWEVFRSVFNSHSNDQRGRDAHPSQHVHIIGNGVKGDSTGLPIGQLIIELHYHSMTDIERFFTGAEQHGLLPFSREINLQPCIAGGKPLAAEYSFINPSAYFAADAHLQQQIPGQFSPTWHVPIKAVIYFLTQRTRVPRMVRALQLLYENFWRDYPHYPVVIFHDDLRPADQRELQAAVPAMALRFVAITLSTPENLRASNVSIPERTLCAPGSSTLGYRHMCRFHATLVHSYLSDLGYAHFDYVMRLDDDSLLTAPVGYDLFRFMRENHKQYAFTNMVADEPACVVDLWEQSATFYNSTVIGKNESSDSLFTSWPKGVVFYNNFEISAFSLWQQPLWRAYMQYIDNLGGIYTLRWGDAPLHTIGVTMMLDRDSIHAFTDIGYRHDPFIDQAPTGLPMPHMDPFVGPNVACHYYDKWMCFYTHHGHNVSFNGTHNSTVSLAFNGSYSLAALLQDHRIPKIHYMNATASGDKGATAPNRGRKERLPHSGATVKLPTLTEQTVHANETVLYTLAHGGKETVLAATLSSFFEHYLSAHPSRVVIFHSDSGSFRPPELLSRLSSSASEGLRRLLQFQAVTLPTISHSPPRTDCAPADVEVRRASVFLRHQAILQLKNMGFTWLLRFADDARLNSLVAQNMFVHLHSSGALFGYKDVVPSNPTCVADLWDLAGKLCRSSGASSRLLRRHAKKSVALGHDASGSVGGTGSDSGGDCSALFGTWKPYQEIVTSFSISHVSVYDAPPCSRLLDATRPNPSLPLWLDSSIHTLCVLAALAPAQILQLRDVDYSFNWTSPYTSTTIEAYDRAFDAHRVGWLGGDVAASVVLPAVTSSGASAATPSDRVLWLFGDSIIGVSDNTRRIKEFSTIVSNSVAIMRYGADRSDATCLRTIDAITYFWGTNAEGTPQPVFDLAPLHDCRRDLQRVWPIAGVAVVLASGATKLIVVVQVVCLPESSNGVGLQFQAYETALLIVHNPLDSPQTWRYDVKYFPPVAVGMLHWMAISPTSGAPIATIDDQLYLLGGYRPATTPTSGAGDKDKQTDNINSGYQVLGQISVADALTLDLTAVTVLAGSSSSGQPTWRRVYSTSAEQPVSYLALFAPLVSEASLHFDHRLHEWIAVSLLFWEERIHVCRTQNITQGDWSCGYVTAIPPPPQMISYAAKAHPHMLTTTNCPTTTAASGEKAVPALDLVVSYVSNTIESADILFQPEHLRTYTPKFARIAPTQ